MVAPVHLYDSNSHKEERVMEREVAIRKKRFTAFWLAFALVLNQVMPITVNAADYQVDSALSGKTVVAGDTLEYLSGSYPIYYINYEGTAELGNTVAELNTPYTVLDYYDSTLSSPALPEGATFVGWSVDVVYGSGNAPESVVLRALISYPITYEVNGGTNGANPSQYIYGEGVGSFANATKEGYVFDGWYKDSGFSEKVETISATQTGAYALYAKFRLYLVGTGTFYLENGLPYQLGSGGQIVPGDSSVYSNGIVFYVPQSGNYTFE